MSELHYLSVHHNQTIAGIQDKFNQVFPFLKIEFFREKHQKGIGSEKKKMYSDKAIKLTDIQKVPQHGKISMFGKETVQELEADFEQKYGLYIQVFRKSGNIWLETSTTDSWTLNQQNEEAKSLQDDLRTEKENPADHDIW